MANKFSIALKVKNNEVVESVIVARSEAEKAIAAFKGWRDEGFEAYLFNSPEADKRCKEAVNTAPTIVEQVVAAVTKKKQKASVPSIDIE
jgi:vacuolar-type H+-ATPase subunit H